MVVYTSVTNNLFYILREIDVLLISVVTSALRGYSNGSLNMHLAQYPVFPHWSMPGAPVGMNETGNHPVIHSLLLIMHNIDGICVF